MSSSRKRQRHMRDRSALATLLISMTGSALMSASTPACAQRSQSSGPEASARDTLRMANAVQAGLTSNVSSLLALQGGLLVLDNGVTPHLTFLDPSTGRVLSKMGVHGTGTSQLEMPLCLQRVPGKADAFWISDSQRRRLLTIALHPGILSEIVRVDTWPNVQPMCAFRFGDLVLIDAAFPDRVFYHANLQTGRLESTAEAPPFRDEVPYNRKHTTMQPSGEKLATAYHYVSTLEIFDSTGKRLLRVDGPVPSEPRVLLAYLYVASTSRFIYAGFCGCEQRGFPAAHELHVFTWDGRLVARIPLDRGVFAMAIPEGDSELFAAYGNSGEMAVGRWRLPLIGLSTQRRRER